MDNIGTVEKEDESVKIVVRKNVVDDMVNKLYKTWYEVEGLSRKEDMKEKATKESPKEPMNISKEALLALTSNR